MYFFVRITCLVSLVNEGLKKQIDRAGQLFN